MESQKPTSSTQLGIAFMEVLKAAATVFMATMMDFLRRKAQKAEDGRAVAETDLAIMTKQKKAEEAFSGKSDTDVISDFLATGGDGPRSGPPQ